jgi:hypothetical protein
VEGFADMAAPLYDLLRKGKIFEWSESCQESFEWLKDALTMAPVLGMPNERDTFLLDTDASDEAIGAVLSQLQDGREVVIAYASRRLSQAERNYCVTRRELLAVVAFVKYFRHYILGRHFVIRTDHAALQWLHRVSEPIGQQARWLELLEEYDFEIDHRSGSRHGNADTMSRRPCDRPRCCRQPNAKENTDKQVKHTGVSAHCFVVSEAGNDPVSDDAWTAEALAESQNRDPDIGPVRELLLNSPEKPPWDMVSGLSLASKSLWRQWERLRIFRGVVMRRFEEPDGRLAHMQTIIPASRRMEFVMLVHEGPTGGHLGRRRTRHKVQLRAYWPGWTEDVT